MSACQCLRTITFVLILWLAPTFIAGAFAQCMGGGDCGASGGGDPRAQASGIFGERCSACHGPEGRGDGPGAAALKPRPANFRSHDWQKSVTDDQMAKAIVEGGASVGRSSQMPGNPDLEDQPDVVKALVVYIRGLGK